jgi:lysophospholipase L1-like esterase
MYTSISGKRRALGYCALGDSLTAGVGSSYFMYGFITRYLYLTRQAFPVHIFPNLFGKSGATSQEIAKSVQFPVIREAIKHADIITITAGGNDLIHAAKAFLKTKNQQEFMKALDHCHVNIQQLLHEIDYIKGRDPYIIRALNLYNPFTSISGTDQWVTAFNRNIEGLLSRKNGRVADIHSLFFGKEKELLAGDHVHPNDKGYIIIANALHGLGYGGLEKMVN